MRLLAALKPRAWVSEEILEGRLTACSRVVGTRRLAFTPHFILFPYVCIFILMSPNFIILFIYIYLLYKNILPPQDGWHISMPREKNERKKRSRHSG